MSNTVPSENHIVVFNNSNIRRTFHEGEWWFSVIDIVKALTDSANARDIYKAKGYDDAWIEKRMRGIQVRAELTDEWENRNVGVRSEYAILTAEITKATFGMTPTEYKQLKGLERENLRDHMNDLELIFSMLGEASTIEIAREWFPASSAR
jgi:hypothetical protein